MTGWSRTAALVTVLALMASPMMGSVPPRGELELSVSVIVNPGEGLPSTVCETSEKVPTHGRWEWRVSVVEAQQPSDRDWRAIGDGIDCTGGSDQQLRELGASPRAPHLIAEVAANSRLLTHVLTPQRVIEMNLSLAMRRRASSAGVEGEPDYQESVAKRSFWLVEGDEAVVPVLLSAGAELEAVGIRDVFLRITLGRAREDGAAAYGDVLVRSSLAGAEVLLDGAAVARTTAGEQTVLRNVPTGLRQVLARDAAGREVGKVVRVRANRTVLVDLRVLDSAAEAARYRLVPLGENTQGYEEFRRESDGAVVVKIPAGEFLMGNKETERTPLEHQVYVSEFLMDKTGVTWGQYKRFAAATGTPLPLQKPFWGIHDDHPVVYVSWEEARTYCGWAGARLPTEAEREKAARGTDGRKYPWGEEEPNEELGVHRRTWGHEGTAAVGSHPAGVSPYGLHDMGGNVWEWCSDWYGGDYYESSPYRDPKGPPSGNAHVVRGGSWDSRPTVLSASCRSWGHHGYREGDFGFRCAMDAPR